MLGQHDWNIWSIVFSPDGQSVATASNDGWVKLWRWDPSRLSLSREPALALPIRAGGFGERVAFSPDDRLLITGGEDNAVKIWDANTGQERQKLRGHTGVIMSLAFSRNGRRLASGSRDHTVKLWDTTRWAEAPGR